MCSHLPARAPLVLAAVVYAAAAGVAADAPLSRVELAKRGKASTVLVQFKDPMAGLGSGTAFCVHPSGLFLTNEHLAKGQVTITLNASLAGEAEHLAKVVRSDKELDLALLKVDGVKGLPHLAVGSDEALVELTEVVAFGFPFGTDLAARGKEKPAVSVNVGSVTSLRRLGGKLHRIQLDAALNPGNSGGPVLDSQGKVVGVVVAGVRGSGVNFAIPSSVVAGFVARPEIQFNPPTPRPDNVYQPTRFEAQVLPVLPTADELTVDLLLKPANGRERAYRMKGAGGTYQVDAAPLPRPERPVRQRLVARFDNASLNGTAEDLTFQVGGHRVQLSAVKSLRSHPRPQALLHDGKTLEGAVRGLEAVQVHLGDQTVALNLSRALEVRCALALETDLIYSTLLVRSGGKELYRHTESLLVPGLLPVPRGEGEGREIYPPSLDSDKVVRKVGGEISDVAVGGGGRYLLLHLRRERCLAVFDVTSAAVAGQIPVKEDNILFAAGQEVALIYHPAADTLERWNLRKLKREVSTAMPVRGPIKSMTMGSASNGPLLVHAADGTKPLDVANYSVVNVQTLRATEARIKAHFFMGSRSRDIVHVRAAANGNTFGLWKSDQYPTGMGVLLFSGSEVSDMKYIHDNVGYVQPGPDGRFLFTGRGKQVANISPDGRIEPGDAQLPGHHGNQYLVLPKTATDEVALIYALGRGTPIGKLTGFEFCAPNVNDGRALPQWDFTLDKRIHLIPDARLVITIPTTNDQLVLRRYGG